MSDYRVKVPAAAIALLFSYALVDAAPVLLLGVPVALLVGVGIVARKTMPAGLSPASSLQLLGGTVGILAAYALVYVLATVTDLQAFRFVIFALPGLLFGAVIRRLWMIAIPVAAAAVILTIAYLQDPSCADCGEGTWSSGIGITLLYVMAPAILTIEVGILIRNLLTRLHLRRGLPS